MNAYTAIATRKSVRAFQEWRFVAARNPGTRKQLDIAANRQMFISYDVSLLIKNTLLYFILDKKTDISYILSLVSG